ncbi:MAG: lytic transglycosylase domain-containing protein [Bryobacteraceae bacterium]
MRVVTILLATRLLGFAADPADGRAAQEASIARQRASIQQQLDAVAPQRPKDARSFFVIPFPPLPAVSPASCDPGSSGDVDRAIEQSAQKEGLDVRLVRAVVRQESAFNPCAVSPKGAQGLMQLMPAVQDQFGVTDPFDVSQNIGAGARLLKQLLSQYNGDLRLALSAYNAGPRRVDNAAGVPRIPETMDYVSSILNALAVK